MKKQGLTRRRKESEEGRLVNSFFSSVAASREIIVRVYEYTHILGKIFVAQPVGNVIHS